MLDTTVSAAEQAAELQFWQNLNTFFSIAIPVLIIILIVLTAMKIYIRITQFREDFNDARAKNKARKEAKRKK